MGGFEVLNHTGRLAHQQSADPTAKAWNDIARATHMPMPYDGRQTPMQLYLGKAQVQCVEEHCRPGHVCWEECA